MTERQRKRLMTIIAKLEALQGELGQEGDALMEPKRLLIKLEARAYSKADKP